MRGEAKVRATHLRRAAVVYVRQSTLAQVREHTESTMRQYALAEEAARLGWPMGAVEVIDADLGISGRSMQGRDGFKHLVARVCLGEVGAVFGLEISRLARSSADLSRLPELARLTDTLVIDADGIYDLADFNDRLLLGLKGTMSEAELHLLAAGCRAQNVPRPNGVSCAPRYPSATSMTRTVRSSWTPTRRSPPRSRTCSPRSPPPGRPTGWSRRSPGAGSPAVPSAAPGPGGSASTG